MTSKIKPTAEPNKALAKLPEPDPAKTFTLNPDVDMTKRSESKRKHHRVGTRTHLYISLVVIAFTVLAVAYALTNVQNSVRRNAELNRLTQPVQAMVMEHRISLEGRLNDVQHWYLTYQFAIGEPLTAYRREIEVNENMYTRFPVGSTILVKYMTNDPNRSTIYDLDFEPVEYDFYAIMTFVPIILLAITLVWAGWVSVRNIRYERFGRVIQGEIVTCVGKVIAGRYTLRIVYKFPTPDDETLSGKYNREREDLRDKPLPKPGDPIAVLYVGKRTFRVI